MFVSFLAKESKARKWSKTMKEDLEQGLNELALFSDETPFFRRPLEPNQNDCVTVRLRAAKGEVDQVFLVWEENKKPMEKAWTDAVFDFYEGILPPSKETIAYYFLLEKGGETYYYSKVGCSREVLPYANFTVIRNFHPPLWSRGSLMYQIYVDRFCNGDETNDVLDGEYFYLNRQVTKTKDWYAPPQCPDYANFYGGDLEGVRQKLGYLKQLGVDAIYFNPIFVSPSNHKYDTQDYDHVDPHLGKIVQEDGTVLPPEAEDNSQASRYISRTTSDENLTASDALFCQLVQEAHKLGMKVILDGVFNHCGAFHRWLDREGFYRDQTPGAFQKEDSPYHDYFVWREDGSWPENYEGWWGFCNHPKLNYEGSSALFDAVMAVAKKWLMPPFDADGWRVDVAADLGQSPEMNHHFWREFRKAVKSAKPEAVILAEHYGDPSPWLMGDQWDTIMNYDAFMDPVSFFLTGMEKHSDAFRPDLYNQAGIFANTMVQKMARLPQQTLFTAMNELSNHDHSRFLTRTNQVSGRVEQLGSQKAEENVNVAVMREAVMLQMTWVGAPTVYYGDEVGLCGFTDPDNRRTYPWGREDRSLMEYHQELMQLRKQHPVFSFGSTLFLVEDYGVVAYGRFDEKERMVVALNNLEEEKSVAIPVWRIGVRDGSSMSKLYVTDQTGFGYSGQRFLVQEGLVRLTLQPRSGVILKDETTLARR